ncbi:FecR domain-containing protein [Galbibacter sp. BG1]|uniref:FecR family protein n=1 Tax=Galbibacter sp. BG1 TaxID=1170699 RepID=UPI0015C17833|nr:FecR domain-containing protein [Galbibacter sp. BG1]QLE00407.1 FecR domain-containing protein [Galbibacter sp. BG1]
MQNEDNILKWLNGDMSEGELQEFKNTEDYKALQPIIAETKKIKQPKLDVEESLAKLKTRQSKKIASKTPWMKIAAVAILFLLAGSLLFYFSGSTTVITTNIAETTTVELPDNSEVVLNAASKIEYDKGKWDDNRQVILDGEAYFKVAKGKKFTVETNYGNVEVLGTQFNVRERDGLYEVVCYEGKVKVSKAGEERILKAGNYVKMLPNNSLSSVENVKDSEPAWLQDKTNFHQTELSLVLAELQRHYAIKVSVEDKALLQKKFTGSFVNNDLVKALEVISYTLNLKYDIKNDKEVLLYAE